MIRDATEARMLCAEPTAAFVRHGRVFGFIPAVTAEVASPRTPAVQAWSDALREFASRHPAPLA